MNDELGQPEVKIHREYFQKSKIWPLSLVFVTDGQKDRIDSRKIGKFIIAGFVIVNIFGFLVGAPNSETTQREPIKINLLGTSYQVFDIPPGISDPDRPLPKSLIKTKGRVPVYSGGEVLDRPRLGALPPGLTSRAKLISGSGAGSIKAQLLEPLMNNGETLLESGLILWGVGSPAEDRIQVQFTKVIYPDGKIENTHAIALDGEDQTTGIRGDPVKKYAGLFGGSAAISFVGGVADGLQDSETKNGITSKKTNVKNAVLAGVAKTAIEHSRESSNKWQTQKLKVSLRPGIEIIIMFEGD
jgi:hypothetical protein